MSEPDVRSAAYVSPSAQLYGSIRLGEGVSIWHNAVLRAECQHIEVGRMTNLQDFGLLTAFAISTAFFADILLAPALMTYAARFSSVGPATRS